MVINREGMKWRGKKNDRKRRVKRRLWVTSPKQQVDLATTSLRSQIANPPGNIVRCAYELRTALTAFSAEESSMKVELVGVCSTHGPVSNMMTPVLSITVSPLV
jgi:hypothetical protein